ncbi:hypothetical protein BaRGS_00021761 [Batillaria attramentaria]|uniref:Cadherin domain-containing protein n=1 Tax=Batillaria attramentaria TaxID=370345 RepID=A0ABD0KIE7_9CAEN
MYTSALNHSTFSTSASAWDVSAVGVLVGEASSLRGGNIKVATAFLGGKKRGSGPNIYTGVFGVSPSQTRRACSSLTFSSSPSWPFGGAVVTVAIAFRAFCVLEDVSQLGSGVEDGGETGLKGRNGDVRYSLVGDSNLLFTVDPVTGTIQTAAPLDREAQATYTLDVMATDQAHNPEDRLSTTAEVTVVLLDVNDCPPEFTSPNVTFVKEETQNGTVVFTVAATDLDAGVNSDVTFTLAQLPSLGYPFVLDRDTGHLKVNSVLRREIVANYTLTVTATDGGSPALSSTQQLTVHIQDVNNNPPVFSKNVYRETVPEDTSVGTSLLRVVATDVDEGLNGIVRYFIISGDDSYDFSLDMASGVLRLQKNLDHERVQEYTLTVRAEDSGVEKTLSSEATVFITVGDVNDFQPVFDDSPYIAYVQEGMTDVPVEVTTVTARDEDSDKDDNNKVAYQLRDVGNQVQGIFQINELSGQIMALSALDREARPMYTLTVIATDTGTEEAVEVKDGKSLPAVGIPGVFMDETNSLIAL